WSADRACTRHWRPFESGPAIETAPFRWSALFELLIAQPRVFFTPTGTPCRVGHRSLRLLIVPKPKPFARADDSNGWEGILTLTGGAWSTAGKPDFGLPEQHPMEAGSREKPNFGYCPMGGSNARIRCASRSRAGDATRRPRERGSASISLTR